MFPAFLTLTAIYIIMVNIGDVFPPIGLDTLPGLILVYLGGAMGVNAWLIKGFFDTIPIEIDESAKVDGATHGQVFWGIILPLAVPVLAVVGLLSFIGTINEFIIASALIQTPSTKTLAVGLQGFIANAYSENWGPFAAGALLAAIPVVILFIVLQKFIVGGLTAGSVKG
jgi:arabinogalactan oligomer/maltooligosaccharide transport system permease protein